MASEVQPTRGHAFISYVREDAERVDQVAGHLRQAGIRIWRDTDDLRPGQDWRTAIRQAINDEAFVFIACFSRASVSRRATYQNEELVVAAEQMRLRRPGRAWIIPVRFDPVEIPAIDLGEGRNLATLQYLDLFEDALGPNLDELVSAIYSVLSAETQERHAANQDRCHSDTKIKSWTGEVIGEAPRPTCFAIMPITMPEGRLEYYDWDADHFSNILQHLFTPAAKGAGFEIVPPAVIDGDLVQAAIIRNLRFADLVLCDLSTMNSNVLFELGIRVALDKPVAIVKDSQTKTLPFDVRGISFHTYKWSHSSWAAEEEIERLTSYILGSGRHKQNNLWKYFVTDEE